MTNPPVPVLPAQAAALPGAAARPLPARWHRSDSASSPCPAPGSVGRLRSAARRGSGPAALRGAAFPREPRLFSPGGRGQSQARGARGRRASQQGPAAMATSAPESGAWESGGRAQGPWRGSPALLERPEGGRSRRSPAAPGITHPDGAAAPHIPARLGGHCACATLKPRVPHEHVPSKSCAPAARSRRSYTGGRGQP